MNSHWHITEIRQTMLIVFIGNYFILSYGLSVVFNKATRDMQLVKTGNVLFFLWSSTICPPLDGHRTYIWLPLCTCKSGKIQQLLLGPKCLHHGPVSQITTHSSFTLRGKVFFMFLLGCIFCRKICLLCNRTTSSTDIEVNFASDASFFFHCFPSDTESDIHSDTNISCPTAFKCYFV